MVYLLIAIFLGMLAAEDFSSFNLWHLLLILYLGYFTVAFIMFCHDDKKK